MPSLITFLTSIESGHWYRHQAAVFYEGQEKPEEVLSYLKTGLEANQSRFAACFDRQVCDSS